VLSALLVFTAAQANAAAVVREPYLQQVSASAATVAFRTDAACAARIHYGQGALTQQANGAASGTRHAVELRDLSPGTEYQYQLEACGTRLGPVRKFRTAPRPGTRSVHFAAVGDFGTGGADERAMAAEVLRQRPELLITLGDNAYNSGTEAEFQTRFFEPMAAALAEVPLFASLGNHEYVTAAGQPYLDNLYLPSNNPHRSERYYSFDWGHTHFVTLDSSCAMGYATLAECTVAEQKAWLEKDLAESSAPWTVVFFHHPPYSSGEHGSTALMQKEFVPLFEKHGVDLVLTGHDHNYERTHSLKGGQVVPANTPGSVVYLVVGNGGANLKAVAATKPAWSANRNTQSKGYLEVKVHEGRLEGRLIDLAGQTQDSFVLEKTLPPPPVEPPGAPSDGEPSIPGDTSTLEPGAPTSSEDREAGGERKPTAAGCSAPGFGPLGGSTLLALCGLGLLRWRSLRKRG
jgi:hypothetical protein